METKLLLLLFVLKLSPRKLVQTESQTDEENIGAEAGEQCKYLGGAEGGAEEKTNRVGSRI